MSNMDTQKNPNEVILKNWNRQESRRRAEVMAAIALVLVLIAAIMAPSGLLETLAGGSPETQSGTEGVEDSLETELSMISETQEEDAAASKGTSEKGISGNESADAESESANPYDLTDVIEVPDVDYPYYIKVNRQANCVTVYTLDEDGNYTVPIKAMVCSVGLNNATPLGVFTTSDKYTWRALYGDVYGQYAFRIDGSIMFHSVPYYTTNKDDLETEEYNKLGEAASLGCIRLCCADAKWLVDNCPSGTQVEIYEDEDPGPLGKPSAIQIDPDSPYAGWDPTDPDPDNPWNVGADTTEEEMTEEEVSETQSESEEQVSQQPASEPEPEIVSEAQPESESEENVTSDPETESQAESEKVSESASESSSETQKESEAEKESEKEKESEAEKESEKEKESEAEKESEKEKESEAQNSSEEESEADTQDTVPQISVKNDFITITAADESNVRACLLANLNYEDREEYWVLVQYSELKAAVQSHKYGIYTCTAYIKDLDSGVVSETVQFEVQYSPGS